MYFSVKQILREIPGTTRQKIKNVLNGKTKFCAGFKWKRIDFYE